MQYIAVFSGLVTAIIGLLTIYQLLKSTPQKRPGAILGVITVILIVVTVVLANSPLSQGGGATATNNTGNTTSTAITSSSTSAPPPKVISVNLSIPCISSDCSYHPLQLTLATIAVDSTNTQTALTFKVREGCTSLTGTAFQKVELQDPAGNTYTGTVSDNSWLADTIIKVAVFDNLVMQKNVEYLLSVGMSCSIYNDTFKTEYIKI